MPDFEQELIARLRRGTSAAPVEATPGPADDPEAALIARLRADALGQQLAAPTKENPRGQVLPTPGWNMGASIAHGMMQGWLPNIMGAFGAGKLSDVYSEALKNPAGEAPEFTKRYEARTAEIEQARKAYERENPGKALVGELGGSMATAVPAMATAAGALAPVGRAVAGLGPWGAGLVDFLSGASQGAARIPSLAARGAAEGTEAAALSSGLSDKPLEEQLKTGAGVGALVNPVVGKIVDKIGGHVSRTAAESAQALLDAGVPVRAGQIPGSNKVAQGLDKLFGGGAAAQREEFATALSKHAGYPTKEINQEWVNTAKKTEGKVMEDIQSVYKIPPKDTDLVLDLDSARLRALSKFSDPTDIKKVNSFFDKLDVHAAKGMDGPIYKNIVEKDGLISNFVSGDQFRKVAGDVREIFDDAWGRHLPTDKKAAWDEARKRYRVIDTIDNSMGATGASEGVYNPKKLLAAVERKYGNVENAGELGLLARGGQFLEPPGATPASAKHPAMKTVGGLALAGAAGAAASEGSKVITHWGPEALAALSQHPETFALPLALAAGIYGGGKGANALLNSPRATQYLLDVSMGSRSPTLRGTNPLIPLLVEGYNRQ